jgi:DNA repair protein RadC
MDVNRMGDVELLQVVLGHQTALKLCRRSLHEIFEVAGEEGCRHPKLIAARELVMRLLREQMGRRNVLSAPEAVKDYLRLIFRDKDREVFVAIFLDAQNRVIESEELFQGTLTQTSVYPREVVKQALKHNAGAVILAHNHPSGVAEPSMADETLTKALKQALVLVDIKVLDHFVVAGNSTTSFSERGLL